MATETMDGVPQLVYMAAIWLGLLGLFFWFIVRPHKKRVADHKELTQSVQRGERVITAGGLHGTVVGLQEETITLEVANGVQVILDRRAIRRKSGDEEGSE